jgi:hypothetical protein
MKSKDQQLLEEAYGKVYIDRKTVINELFDTKKKIKWQKPKDEFENYQASFKAPNGKTYGILLAPTQWAVDEDEMFEGFPGTEEEFDSIFGMSSGADLPTSYLLEFSDEDDDTIEITGEGSAAAVFGIVANAVTDLIKNHSHIKHVVFSAKEPSRRSLYSRLAPIIAKRNGFKLSVSENKQFYYLSR